MLTARTSWVKGAWLAARGTPFERVNPADAREATGSYFAASLTDVDDAMESAASAQRDWAAVPAPLRGDVLARAAGVVRRRADAIAQVLTREEGKTLAEAKGEVHAGADILEFVGSGGRWALAGQLSDSHRPTTLLYSRRQSRGVVAAITPWNFPFSNPCIKLASALVAGNTVVWKPAPFTPATALALTECFTEAGLPAGALATLLGDADVGRRVIDDPRVRAVSFTGSTTVGRQLATQLAARGVPAQLEMGGKNAVVVLEDADVQRAARDTAHAAFLSAGQKCTAASRVILTPGVRDTFVEALLAATRALRVGDPTDPETDVGPVIHERPLQDHLTRVQRAVGEGARLIEGGNRLDGDLAKGFFMAPTILDRVAPTARIALEEVFGPVLAIVDAAGYADALRIVNNTTYGLVASVYTRDLALAMDFAERCESGVVKVNEPPTGLDPHMPTGGWKNSGAGERELGPTTFLFFTEEKTVYLNHLGVAS